MYTDHRTFNERHSALAMRASILDHLKMMPAVAFILMGLVSAFGGWSVVDGAPDNDPKTTVMSTVTQATGILQDRRTPQAVRRRQLIQVVAGHFSFSDMARSSLGYHWRQLTSDQQQRFVQLFTAFLENAYLNKLEDYSGQKIAFVGETSTSPGDSEVNTAVIQSNDDQRIRIDYLLKQDGGDWKVYDVTVDNISIMANYRNQFNRIINEQGFDALLKEMQSKQQELVASLGK